MSDSNPEIRLAFDEGTLVLLGVEDDFEPPGPFVWDSRVGRWRALAHRYREIVETLQAREVDIRNIVPRYNRLRLDLRSQHPPPSPPGRSPPGLARRRSQGRRRPPHWLRKVPPRPHGAR